MNKDFVIKHVNGDMGNDCIFCKIRSGAITAFRVYEDDGFIAFMDIYPAVRGHTLVIPKWHFRNMLDTPETIGKNFYNVISKVANAVKKAFNADGIYMFQQNESAAGQEIFHSHVHIIPRYKGDDFGKFSPPRLKVDLKDIEKDSEKIRQSF